jgi:hypothetical protein
MNVRGPRANQPTDEPGWWLASDGNWYAPELAPASPVDPSAASVTSGTLGLGTTAGENLIDGAERGSSKKLPGKTRFIVALAVIVLLAVGGLIAATIGDHKKSSSASEPATTTPPPSSPTPQAAAWASTSIASFRVLLSDMQSIISDLNSHDVTKLMLDCQATRADVAKAQPSADTAPDAAVGASLARALDWFDGTLTSCEHGDIQATVNAISTGSPLLQESTNALKTWEAQHGSGQ